MQAWIPVWIIGAPFAAILILSAVFKGGTSAATQSSVNTVYPR
jgi:hypothetical protein